MMRIFRVTLLAVSSIPLLFACGGGGFSLPADATVIEQEAAAAASQLPIIFAFGLDCTDCMDTQIQFWNAEGTTLTNTTVVTSIGASETMVAVGDVTCRVETSATGAPVMGFPESERQLVSFTVLSDDPAGCGPVPVGGNGMETHVSITRDEDGIATSTVIVPNPTGAIDGFFFDNTAMNGAFPLAQCNDETALTAGDGSPYCPPADCVWDFASDPQTAAGGPCDLPPI